MSLWIELLQVGLPVYVANGSPPFLINLKKHALDFGKKWKGRRLLGDGKTWEGLFFAVIMCTVAGGLVNTFLPNPVLNISVFGYSFIGLGVMIGDAAGSFVKRRQGLKRGAPGGLLDMIDFMIGGLLFTRILTSFSWMTALLLLLLTPVIHRIANIIGYRIGVKKEPW